MRITKYLTALFALIGCIPNIIGQTSTAYSKAVQERIVQVENSLGLSFDSELKSMESQMARYQLSGVSIAVINNFEVEWAKAYGVIDNQEVKPVTTETVFQAASMSKTVNSMALLNLAEKKELNLDAEINTLLKSWQLSYDPKVSDQKVTLRQLLSHTAGLSIHGFSGYKSASDLPNITQILSGQNPAKSKTVVPIMAPNKAFKYSGGGTTLTQLVLMDTEGISYEKYLAQHLFQPLGLKHAFYSVELDRYSGQEMAHGHVGKGKPIKNEYNYYPESAAAGLWITPTDLAKVLIDLQQSLNGKEGKILTQSSAREMISPPIEKGLSGLGVFIEKMKTETYLQHSGSNRGFRGKYMIGANNGMGVVVMVNDSKTEIIEEIIESVARVYEWPGFKSMKIADVSFTKTDIAAYSGVYQNKKRMITVKYEKGSFVMSEKGKWSSKLLPMSANSFVLKDIKPQTTVDFVADESGKIIKLIATQGDSLNWKKLDNQK